jgi:rhodanese-related sulfurtransferase
MDKLGFKKLFNLEGGIVAWEQAGQALIKNEN